VRLPILEAPCASGFPKKQKHSEMATPSEPGLDRRGHYGPGLSRSGSCDVPGERPGRVDRDVENDGLNGVDGPATCK